MKPYYKPLKEIDDTTKFYRCKVTVYQKGRPQQPHNKPRYQRIIFKDDEGFTMKATIFGSDIDAYAEALQRNDQYEIANAIIKPVPPQYATREREFSMTINKKAEIIPLTKDRQLLTPQYQPISSIPQTSSATEMFDIVGIILHITNKREVSHTAREPDQVVEIYVTDESCDRPLMISTWNDLSVLPPRLLSSWSQTFTTIGFTAIRPKTYKGFTLTTTMSSDILLNPSGPTADRLRTWATENSFQLASQTNKLLNVLASATATHITPISQINCKMAHDTWQEEHYLIKGTLPAISNEKLKLYLGCSNCGKSMNIEMGATSNCNQCYTKNTICKPRATMKTEIVDETGELELSFYNREIEILAECTCADLWNIKDNAQQLATKIEYIKTQVFQVQVAPTMSLSKSRILKWTIRQIATASASTFTTSTSQTTLASSSTFTPSTAIFNAHSEAANVFNPEKQPITNN